MTRIRKAIFPVGGLGTRFLPATKSLPKEMLPVASKPLIQYAFEEAKSAGIEEFIFIMGRNKNAISNHFDHSYELQKVLSEKEKKTELSIVRDWLPDAGQIAFIRQQKPKGLGHAVWCARNFINNEPFAVILADEMLKTEGGFLKQMVDSYNETGSNIVGVHAVEQEKVMNYGIVAADNLEKNLFKITNMVEKPTKEDAPSNLSIVGRYILKPDIFKYLENAHIGAGGEIQLTDAMKSLMKDEEFHGLKFEGQRFDCGQRLGFLEANIAYEFDLSEKEKIKEILEKYI